MQSDAKKLLNAIAPDRRDDPELRKVRPDRIDHRGLLAHQQMTGAVKRQATLLLGRLGRHEPHVWPAYGFADRRRIGLMPLHLGLQYAGGISQTL